MTEVFSAGGVPSQREGTRAPPRPSSTDIALSSPCRENSEEGMVGCAVLTLGPFRGLEAFRGMGCLRTRPAWTLRGVPAWPEVAAGG